MKIVSVLRFDKEDEIYRVYNPSKNALCMEQLPRIGEKLVFDIEGVSHIAEVIDGSLFYFRWNDRYNNR